MDQLSEADKKQCTDAYNSFERKTIIPSFFKCLMAVLLEDGTPEEQKLSRGLRNKIPLDKQLKARKFVRIKHLIMYDGEIHSNMPAEEEVADEDSQGSMEQQQKQGQRTVLKTVVHGDSVLNELVTQAERLAVQGSASQWFRQENQRVVRPLSAACKAITNILKANAKIGKAIAASQAKSIKQKLLTLSKDGVVDVVEGVLPVVPGSGRPKSNYVGMGDGGNYNARTGKRSYPMVRSKAERMQAGVVLGEGLTAASAAAAVPLVNPVKQGKARKPKRFKATKVMMK
jgi:hypothetical protein